MLSVVLDLYLCTKPDFSATTEPTKVPDPDPASMETCKSVEDAAEEIPKRTKRTVALFVAYNGDGYQVLCDAHTDNGDQSSPLGNAYSVLSCYCSKWARNLRFYSTYMICLGLAIQSENKNSGRGAGRGYTLIRWNINRKSRRHKQGNKRRFDEILASSHQQ